MTLLFPDPDPTIESGLYSVHIKPHHFREKQFGYLKPPTVEVLFNYNNDHDFGWSNADVNDIMIVNLRIGETAVERKRWILHVLNQAINGSGP